MKYIINHDTVKGLGLCIKYIGNTITKIILIAVKKVLTSIPLTTNFQGLHRNKGAGDGLRSSSLWPVLTYNLG